MLSGCGFQPEQEVFFRCGAHRRDIVMCFRRPDTKRVQTSWVKELMKSFHLTIINNLLDSAQQQAIGGGGGLPGWGGQKIRDGFWHFPQNNLLVGLCCFLGRTNRQSPRFCRKRQTTPLLCTLSLPPQPSTTADIKTGVWNFCFFQKSCLCSSHLM